MIKPIFKYITSTSHIKYDESGNVIVTRVVKDNGDARVLKFIIRTDDDVRRDRINSYPILVP